MHCEGGGSSYCSVEALVMIVERKGVSQSVRDRVNRGTRRNYVLPRNGLGLRLKKKSRKEEGGGPGTSRMSRELTYGSVGTGGEIPPLLPGSVRKGPEKGSGESSGGEPAANP